MNKIPEEQVLNRVLLENIWWSDTLGSIKLPYSTFSPRPYLKLFMPLILERSVNRAIVLMGPRRVGKTVMIHHCIQQLININGIDPKKISYFSADHPLYNNLGLEEFLVLYKKKTNIDYTKEECFVFFDEIQYLRNWETHLKIIVDQFPNVKCIASGSAAAALRLKSTESGAGRFTDFLLPPLTFHEYLVLLKKDDLINITSDENGQKFGTPSLDDLNSHFQKYLNFGGYPEVIFSDTIQSDPGRYIKNDIIDKVLLRDLPSLYGIKDIKELNSLFTTLAFNTANEISLDGLSKNSGVVKSTIKRYIEYLEAAFLIRTISRVDKNAKRFQRAVCFKCYLANPSMRTALFSPIESTDQVMGNLVETALFAQWFHFKWPLYYARWKNGEVDLIGLDKDQKVKWAFEAKWSNRYFDNPLELKSLLDFCHSHNLRKAMITTISQYGTKEIKNVMLHFFPASIYAFVIGYNAIQGNPQTELFGDFRIT